MQVMARDTTPEAQAVQTRIYRQMSAHQKFERVYALTQLTREFALARIKRNHPGLDDSAAQARLTEELYGVRPPA